MPSHEPDDRAPRAAGPEPGGPGATRALRSAFVSAPDENA